VLSFYLSSTDLPISTHELWRVSNVYSVVSLQ